MRHVASHARGLLLAVAASCGARGPEIAAAQPGGAAAAQRPRQRGDLVGEITAIVEKDFFAPARLDQVGWPVAVARARRAFAGARTAAARTRAIRDLLAVLGTSHTEYFPRDEPAYWEMASIFEPVIRQQCAADRIPRLPIVRDEIGVFWRRIGSSWFVAGVLAGGPAETAGLVLGDEVLSADGRTFSPVASLAGRAGRTVALRVGRARGARPLELSVTPRSLPPQQAFKEATAKSWRVLERRGKRIGYLRVWSWAGPEIHQEVLRAAARSSGESVDGFILDLRDGWGGASPHNLSLLLPQIPVLTAIDRSGKAQTFEASIRVPAVILTNGGTRSGKEVVAYGARKHRLARLVGERTGGAVVFGGPRCLSDGSLLYLAVMDARVDGERLEGRGVEPDIHVRFDIRHAGGADPQLERALALLAR